MYAKLFWLSYFPLMIMRNNFWFFSEAVSAIVQTNMIFKLKSVRHNVTKKERLLNATFSHQKGTRQPFRKSNNPFYIPNSSNHPSTISKQNPQSISWLLSDNNHAKCNRKWNITWFNTPYNKNIKKKQYMQNIHQTYRQL